MFDSVFLPKRMKFTTHNQTWDFRMLSSPPETNFQPSRSNTHIRVVKVISIEFLGSFLKRHLAGKTLVAKSNLDCFLRITLSTNSSQNARQVRLRNSAEILLLGPPLAYPDLSTRHDWPV